MINFSSRRMSGAKVQHHKNTQDLVPVRIPVPEKVSIPMSMHIGAPCKLQVKVGDEVKVGQVIGDTEAFVSAPIHASVSGKVVAIEQITYLNGSRSDCVVIEADKLQTVHESVQPPVVENREQFVAAVRKSGLVGLGGAGFPTHVKFAPKNLDEVDTLVINSAECEPYITSDYRTLMDEAEEVLEGARAIKQYLELKQVILAIEDNKPEAISKLREMTKDDPEFTVFPLQSVYPKGAEKVAIYETTGRVVKEGQLPADAGVIVSNVTSVAFVAKYLRTGMPLVEKCLTVDGTAVAEPKNVIVPIGTPIAEVMAFCGGYKAEPRLILMGGPMMGTAVFTDAYPVIKNNNALLAFAEQEAKLPDESPCIRCGRCVRACPYHLMPTDIERAYKAQDVEMLEHLKVSLCIECGCCAFSCPAKRYLVLTNRLAKRMVAASKKK